jgi:DNA-binding NarL/FixJ family response regulator
LGTLVIVREVGMTVPQAPAALDAASEPRVLAVVARRTARTRAVLALLGSQGISVAAATHEAALPAEHDVVLVCGTAGRAAVQLVGELSTSSTLPVVAVLPEASPRELRDLIQAGAAGLVLEGEAAAALLPTVRAVHAGQIVVPKALWQRVAKPSLSTREKQALAMVVMGFSNSEIAARLFVTEATVKSHLSSAFAKLGVRSRSEATNRILDPEHGLGTGILAISAGDAAEPSTGGSE